MDFLKCGYLVTGAYVITYKTTFFIAVGIGMIHEKRETLAYKFGMSAYLFLQYDFLGTTIPTCSLQPPHFKSIS